MYILYRHLPTILSLIYTSLILVLNNTPGKSVLIKGYSNDVLSIANLFKDGIPFIEDVRVSYNSVSTSLIPLYRYKKVTLLTDY